MKYSLLIALAAALLGACAPYHRNEAQYDRGDWDFWASHKEVNEIKVDKLAIAKLEAQPVYTTVYFGENGAAAKGYYGLVANLSQYRRYNFVLYGPENKSYLLGAGDKTNDYLLPGHYRWERWEGNSLEATGRFTISTQTHEFMHEDYHWYVYAEW